MTAHLVVINLNLESWFLFRSQLDPSSKKGSSPSTGLQIVIQSTNLFEGLLPPTSIEPTLFQNSVSSLPELQL